MILIQKMNNVYAADQFLGMVVNLYEYIMGWVCNRQNGGPVTSLWHPCRAAWGSIIQGLPTPMSWDDISP
jgi:hypothetical protein